MAAANPELYEDGGGSLLGAFSFGTVPAGTAGTAVVAEVWNAKADPTADTATGVALVVHEATPGLSDWNQRGRATMERWVEFRLVGVIGEVPAQLTAWTPTGTGRPFLLNQIPADSARIVEMRLVVPAGVETEDRDYSVSIVYDQPAVALGIGFEEVGRRGVRGGVGDSTETHLVEGGAVTASGPPDAEIHVADLSWIWQGVPRQLLAHSIETDGDAADGATATGEAYWLAISAGEDPEALTITKGNKGEAPLGTDSRPDVPAGEKLLGYVHREEAGEIAADDIYSDEVTYGRMALQGTGLERFVGVGQAVVDNFLVRFDTRRPVSLPDETADVRLWLLPNVGLLSVQAGAVRPAERALPLWAGATASGDVTAARDLRPILGPPVEVVRFAFGVELAEDQVVCAMSSNAVPAYLRLPEPVWASVNAHGTATAGETVWDVEAWEEGGWVTLFPGAAGRPALAWDSETLVSTAARPTRLLIQPATLLRARVVTVPSGGSAPTGAEVILFMEVSGYV